MEVIDRIGDFFFDIASFFLRLAWESWEAPLIPRVIGDFFNNLSKTFNDIGNKFYHFSERLDNIIDTVREIISWEDIKDFLKDPLGHLDDLWEWFLDRLNWVRDEIADWWEDKDNPVRPYLDQAIENVKTWWEDPDNPIRVLIDNVDQGLAELKVKWDNFLTETFPEWTSKFDDLKVKWDNFWTETFPTLVDMTWLGEWWGSRSKEINDLIESWFKDFEHFWAGWEDMRDTVFGFFDDPLQWLLDRFTDWFLGPEE